MEERVLQEKQTWFLEYKAGLGLSVPWGNELALRTMKLLIWLGGVCTEDLCPLSRWPTFLPGHLLPVEAEIPLLCEHEHVCACGGQSPKPKARGPPQLLTTSLWQGLLQNLTSEPQGGPQHPPPAPAPVITGSHSCACVSMCAYVASVYACVCV